MLGAYPGFLSLLSMTAFNGLSQVQPTLSSHERQTTVGSPFSSTVRQTSHETSLTFTDGSIIQSHSSLETSGGKQPAPLQTNPSVHLSSPQLHFFEALNGYRGDLGGTRLYLGETGLSDDGMKGSNISRAFSMRGFICLSNWVSCIPCSC
jgi:hypothetical protein